MTHLKGASPDEQRLYDHIVAHAQGEGEALRAYADLASATSSQAFAFLAELILEDERRHHEILDRLASAVRASVEMSPEARGMPFLDLDAAGGEVHEATARLLDIEIEDARALRALSEDLAPYADTTLWSLIVEVLRADTAKHQAILRFIERHLD